MTAQRFAASATPPDGEPLPGAAVRDERIQLPAGIALAVRRWSAPGAPARNPSPGASGQGGDGHVATSAAFLLVHGLASNARTWDGVAARLALRGHDVAAIDLRGHGRSDKPADGYDVATVAGDLSAAIDALGLRRPVVAGQSWGGNVVVALGAAHPEAAGAVVGVDGGLIQLGAAFPDWDACVAALTPPRLIGTPRADLERRLRAVHPDWPETGIEGTLHNFEVRADGTIAPWLTLDRHLAILRGLWEHRPLEALQGGYPVPLVLAMAGDPDERDPRQGGIVAARRLIPGLRVEWFAGADHDLHAQHPHLVADLLDSLAREVAR